MTRLICASPLSSLSLSLSLMKTFVRLRETWQEPVLKIARLIAHYIRHKHTGRPVVSVSRPSNESTRHEIQWHTFSFLLVYTHTHIYTHTYDSNDTGHVKHFYFSTLSFILLLLLLLVAAFFVFYFLFGRLAASLSLSLSLSFLLIPSSGRHFHPFLLSSSSSDSSSSSSSSISSLLCYRAGFYSIATNN